jgi:hypothetical protein
VNAAPARRAAAPSADRRLRAVPPPRFRAARAPFVIVVVAILGAGLVGLLLLNTALAQGSFRIHDLQNRTAALQDREQQLQTAVDVAGTPAKLAAAAHRLGLVPATDPGFLRLSDGRVLGEPQAATAAPKPHKATASPAPSAGPSVQPSGRPSPAPSAHTSARSTPGPSPHQGTHG